MLDSLSVGCFRPRKVVNPRFRKDKNSEEFSKAKELYFRDYVENYYIEIPCGKCYLCRKKKASGWRVRLLEECKYTPRFYHNGILKYRCIFVLFTFNNEHLPIVDTRDKIAVFIRKWRDLWRKKFGKSPRYFCVTDRGTQYGRLHLHFLIFDPRDKQGNQLSINRLKKENFFWRNGFVREPTWLETQKGITYVTGYITGSNLEKEAKKHGHVMCKEAMEYNPLVFVSNGLGARYVTESRKYYDTERNMYVYPFQGFTYGLPSYYRYKLVDEELRWHCNLIYKKEKEYYLVKHRDNLLFKFNGNFMSFDTLLTLYESTYKKFDSENNKKLNLYYAKQQPREACELAQTQLSWQLVEGVLQDTNHDEFWKLYPRTPAGDTCELPF